MGCPGKWKHGLKSAVHIPLRFSTCSPEAASGIPCRLARLGLGLWLHHSGDRRCRRAREAVQHIVLAGAASGTRQPSTPSPPALFTRKGM